MNACLWPVCKESVASYRTKENKSTLGPGSPHWPLCRGNGIWYLHVTGGRGTWTWTQQQLQSLASFLSVVSVLANHCCDISGSRDDFCVFPREVWRLGCCHIRNFRAIWNDNWVKIHFCCCLWWYWCYWKTDLISVSAFWDLRISEHWFSFRIFKKESVNLCSIEWWLFCWL